MASRAVTANKLAGGGTGAPPSGGGTGDYTGTGGGGPMLSSNDQGGGGGVVGKTDQSESQNRRDTSGDLEKNLLEKKTKTKKHNNTSYFNVFNVFIKNIT